MPHFTMVGTNKGLNKDNASQVGVQLMPTKHNIDEDNMKCIGPTTIGRSDIACIFQTL